MHPAPNRGHEDAELPVCCCQREGEGRQREARRHCGGGAGAGGAGVGCAAHTVLTAEEECDKALKLQCWVQGAVMPGTAWRLCLCLC